MLRRITFNSAAMVISQAAARGLGLLWVIIMARFLGDTEFGRLTYAFSLAGIVAILIEFGFSSVTTRGVARRPEEAQKYVSNVLALKLLLSLVAVPLIIVFSLATGATRSGLGLVYVAAATSVASALYAVPSSIYFARERMEYPSAFTVASKVAAILLGFLMVRMGLGTGWIALVFLTEAVLNLALGIRFLGRVSPVRFVPRLDSAFCRPLIREALPFALAMALGLVYFRIDAVMLSAMKGSQVVGWYSAGYRLLEGLMFVPGAFLNTVFPVFSRLKTASGESLRNAVGRASEFILAIALPMALGLALASRPIVTTFYGESYAETIPVLHWIGAALLFVFLNYLFGVVLGAVDRQTLHFICALAGVAINISLNLLWIPKYAHVGAARATLVTEALLVLLYSAFVVHYVRPRLDAVRLLKILVSAALMAAALLRWSHAGLAALCALGAAVYVAALLVTRAIRPEEWRQIRHAIFPPRV